MIPTSRFPVSWKSSARCRLIWSSSTRLTAPELSIGFVRPNRQIPVVLSLLWSRLSRSKRSVRSATAQKVPDRIRHFSRRWKKGLWIWSAVVRRLLTIWKWRSAAGLSNSIRSWIGCSRPDSWKLRSGREEPSIPLRLNSNCRLISFRFSGCCYIAAFGFFCFVTFLYFILFYFFA